MCVCGGSQGESGWPQTRVPDPALQNPECQRLNKECLDQTGTGEGLSYVTKAQKRWAGARWSRPPGPGWSGDPGGSETISTLAPLQDHPSSLPLEVICNVETQTVPVTQQG